MTKNLIVVKRLNVDLFATVNQSEVSQFSDLFAFEVFHLLPVILQSGQICYKQAAKYHRYRCSMPTVKCMYEYIPNHRRSLTTSIQQHTMPPHPTPVETMAINKHTQIAVKKYAKY